jgi:dTDP-glucose pyrophosphorylase
LKTPKQYGIIEGKEVGTEVLKVEKLAEKPKTNLAIMAMYIFRPLPKDDPKRP